MKDVDLAALEQAVLDVDGVASLHGGPHGTIATYLPGRRISGVRIDDIGAHVHLAIFEGWDLVAVAESVRSVVAHLLRWDSRSIVVFIEDIVPHPSTDKTDQESS